VSRRTRVLRIDELDMKKGTSGIISSITLEQRQIKEMSCVGPTRKEMTEEKKRFKERKVHPAVKRREKKNEKRGRRPTALKEKKKNGGKILFFG
jgi:hypothetical protein